MRLHALQGTMYDIIVFEYLRFRLSTQLLLLIILKNKKVMPALCLIFLI